MNLEDRIESYWSKRSDKFYDLRVEELNSDKRKLWEDEIISNLPDKENLKILDVGCGPGFFSVILASLGHKVVGIDLTKSMIDRAEQIANMLDYDIDFRVMNAQELDFDDEEFDVVISRNLTWTLPDIEKAYREWYRVLKKDGVLLNFDADYGKVSFREEAKTLGEDHAHSKIEVDLMEECDNIKEELDISKRQRPIWDKEYLKQIGFESCKTDYKVSERIYKVKDDFYNPTPMFKVCAVKMASV